MCELRFSLGVEEAILEHPLFIYIMVMPKHFGWDLCEFFIFYFLFWENKMKKFFVISIPIFRWKNYKFSFNKEKKRKTLLPRILFDLRRSVSLQWKEQRCKQPHSCFEVGPHCALMMVMMMMLQEELPYIHTYIYKHFIKS